jgi:hypothetical protein
MKLSNLRSTLATGALLVTAMALLSGCNEKSTTAQASENAPRSISTASTRSVRSGTTVHVALGSNISSKTAQVGDAWHGTVTESVMNQGETVIPPGSRVDGVVTGALAAQRGSRAMLELGIRGIRVEGHDEAIVASSEPVIAGSTRARNLGAIAGSAAAGALIGKAVGDGKNAAVGGAIGAVAATGVVAASDGYQVVLSDGTVMTFTVSQTVAMR